MDGDHVVDVAAETAAELTVLRAGVTVTVRGGNRLRALTRATAFWLPQA
jgi:hypothetical protein